MAQKEREKEMKVLSLFSGVGGFDLGLENAGMQTVFQCEWDKHATSILERHWPDTPRWGDIATLTGEHILAHAPVIDVVAWGSPCQDLSVAGKRAGLEGSRSGLFHQGIRIINELRKATNNVYPRISIWENVYGALNSNKGSDFGVILDEMAEAGSLVQEWRVLDAQYFGVPQRRRRVFLISVFDPATAANCPDPLLPVCEGVRWDSATSRTARQEPAGTVTDSFASGSFGGWTETDTAITLSARDYKSSNTISVESFTGTSHAQYAEGVGTLRANGGDLSGGSETIVVEPLLIDGTRVDDVRIYDPPVQTLKERMGTGGNNVPVILGDGRTYRNVTGALLGRDSKDLNHEGARDGKLILEQAIPIQDGREIEKHQNGIGVAEPGAPSYTIDQTGAQAVAIGIQGNVIGRQDHNGPAGKGHTEEGDPMFTLTGTDIHAVATLVTMREGKPSGGKLILEQAGHIGFSHTQGLSAQPSEAAWPTLRKEGSGHAVAIPAEAAGFKAGQGAQSRGIGYHEGQAQTLTSDMNGLEPTVLTPTMSVRRLTPLECERLMGWPDRWTETKADGTPQADTHRYKQCGNGVASPVAQWIGEQLLNL